jgi:hypothetical protein
MTRRLAAALLAIVMLTLTACTESDGSADSADRQSARDQQQHYRRSGQVVPFLEFSQDLETLRQIYILRNQEVATHSVLVANDGRVVDDCPSVGYPIPSTTQLTNPEYVADSFRGGYAILPQPEPNGLWTGQSMATWVVCVLPSGKRVPVYWEGLVSAYPYPVEVSGDRMTIRPAGDSDVEVEFGKVQNLGEAAPEAEQPTE